MFVYENRPCRIYEKTDGMVYIDNVRTKQTVRIPRTVESARNEMKVLALRSTFDNSSYSFGMTDSGTSPDYYEFKVTLPRSVQAGEYEYFVYLIGMGSNALLSSGVMEVRPTADNGPQKPEALEYEYYDDEYEQYES